ncbi:MAG: LysM peptidoglycan-binding domain-containing protein, partial [Planctomycetota bacterium]
SVPPPRTPAATPPVVAESAQPGAMREPNAPELSSLPPLATPEPARTSPVPGGGLQPTARPAVAEPSSVSRAPAGETPALPGAGAAAERETGRPAPPSPATAGERYIVKEGDKLAYIAEDYYGDQAAVKQILEANPNIKDPDLIQVGQVIMLPPKGAPGSARSPVAPASPDRAAAPTRTPAAPAPATTPPAAGGAPVAAGRPRTHLVRQGETLTSIARTVLGDASKWRQILELNKDKLDRPEDLQAGMSIKLPDDSGAQGSRTATPTAPTRTAPPRESVRPRR